MTSSDKIALLALVVSLISFCLSYRSTRFSKLLSAAEKKSEVHTILIETLLHGQMLYAIFLNLQKQARAISALPTEIEELERRRAKLLQTLDKNVAEHNSMLKGIEEVLELIRSSNKDDPILFEKAKLLANAINLQMNNITPNIKNMEMSMNVLSKFEPL